MQGILCRALSAKLDGPDGRGTEVLQLAEQAAEPDKTSHVRSFLFPQRRLWNAHKCSFKQMKCVGTPAQCRPILLVELNNSLQHRHAALLIVLKH